MWTAAGALGWWPTVGGEGAWVWSAVAMMGSRPSADKSGAGKRNARARETYSSPQGQTAHRRGSGRRAGPSPRLLCAVGGGFVCRCFEHHIGFGFGVAALLVTSLFVQRRLDKWPSNDGEMMRSARRHYTAGRSMMLLISLYPSQALAPRIKCVCTPMRAVCHRYLRNKKNNNNTGTLPIVFKSSGTLPRLSRC